MRQNRCSPERKNTFSIQDINEQTALEALLARQEGADIVDALLDLHEQRIHRLTLEAAMERSGDSGEGA